MVLENKNNKKYICKYCGKEFDNSHKLGGHIIKCKLNPNYQQYIKNWKISYKNNLLNHNEEFLNFNDQQQCFCKYCNKECKSLNSLKQHECRCKNNPNKIDLTYLSNRDYSKINLNPSNQYIKTKLLGLEKPIISDETRYKLGTGWRGKEMSQELKNKISIAMQKAVKEHPESYFGINTNKRVKKHLYNSIWLDGNWELIFAKYLDTLNIKWERPRKGIEYIWNNSNHVYYPDFYLPEYNLYIEVKGQETERDHAKWNMVSNLLVIKSNEIKQIQRNTYNIFKYLKK